MKKDHCVRRIAFCLTVLMMILGAFAGCSKAASIPDTPVDMTPTDQLVIYAPVWDQPWLSYCQTLFEKEYPDVTVNFEVIGSGIDVEGGMQEYYGRFNTEMMAGGGPDIVVVDPVYFSDIYKTMDTGAFLNLADVVEKDESFNMNQYNQVVMDAGLYKGGRYYIPLNYSIMLLSGMGSRLEQAGYDIDKSGDTAAFIEQCTDVLGKNSDMTQAISMSQSIYYFMRSANLILVNYETGAANMDKNKIRAFCEAYKAYYPIASHEENLYGGMLSFPALKAGKILFDYDYPYTSIEMLSSIQTEDTPVAAAIPSMEGGVQANVEKALAINSNSKNQLNAYRFIKIALSDEVLLNGSLRMGMPVSKSALQSFVNNLRSQQVGSTADGRILTEVSDELSDEIIEILGNPTSCSTFSWTEYEVFIEIMEPYWKGEATFDECYTALEQKINIIASE